MLARRRRPSTTPGAAIQAFWEPVTTMSTPQASIWNGTAPRPDTLSTRIRASGANSRTTAVSSGDRVHHPGRGLVVGEQDGLVVAGPLELRAQLGRVGGLAPFDVDLGDVRAVGPGDLREPVAEGADRDSEDPIARREDVDDRRLEATRPGRREHRHIVGGPEIRLHPGQDPGEHRGEFRAAMVDHLAGAGLADARRERGRAGDPQVGLEAVHGNLLDQPAGHPPARGICSHARPSARYRRRSVLRPF